MLVNAPRGVVIFARVKKQPGVCSTWPGCFLEKKCRALWPPGAIQKQQKTLTPLTHPATPLLQQEVLIMSQPSSTEKAPNTDKSTDETNSWGSLRRPGQAAPTSGSTPAPCPASATAPGARQVLQRRPLPRSYPPSFALESSVGMSGRQSYLEATKRYLGCVLSGRQ